MQPPSLLFFLFIFFTTSSTSCSVDSFQRWLAPYPTCPRMTWSSFKNQYFRYKQDTDEIKLVFFSPWCTACKALMKDPNPVNTVFVNTFDDEAQGAETMWKYSMQASCVTEMDMSEHFQITELPSVRIVTKLSK